MILKSNCHLDRELPAFLFPQARLASTSTKSVTYMPGTFCYRHARSLRLRAAFDSSTCEEGITFAPFNSRAFPLKS
jgi:hypothetical protein